MHDKTAPQLRVDSTLLTGIDVGGTKVHILDTAGNDAHRYLTNDYPTMEAVLDDYFAKIGRRPARISLVMAGPRDDRTGAVKLTNGTWPIFEPRSAEAHYPGTMFETTNDLVGTMAGALIAPDTDLQTLKKGSVSPQGAKVAFALSTGIGVAASIWDSATKRYTMVAGEGGHIGVYPQTLVKWHTSYTYNKDILAFQLS
jgi:glucokinase